MAERVTDELTSEILRTIQDRLARMEHGQNDLRAEQQSTNAHLAALSASYAALVGDGVRRGNELDRLRTRIERIEHRLDLAAPSA